MRFTNDDETLGYLKKHTGLEWEEVTPVYLNFKTHHNPHGQFCVFATPDWIRKGPFAKFYIPKNGEDLHDPARFLQYLNNKGEKLAIGPPWIKIELDNLPRLIGEQIQQNPVNTAFIKYEISLSGALKVKAVGGSTPLSVGRNSSLSIAYSMKSLVTDVFTEASVSFNLAEKTVLFNVGTSTSEVKATLSIEPTKNPNEVKISTEITPKMNNIREIYNGYNIQGELGYKLVGTITYMENPPKTVQSKELMFSPSVSFSPSVASLNEGATHTTLLLIFTVLEGIAMALA